MKLYRIYTENKGKAVIEEEMSVYFPGFTIIEAKGFWAGTKEDSLIIEILTEKKNENLVKVICRKIKRFNEQESVLLTESEVKAEFI